MRHIHVVAFERLDVEAVRALHACARKPRERDALEDLAGRMASDYAPCPQLFTTADVRLLSTMRRRRAGLATGATTRVVEMERQLRLRLESARD